MAPPPIIQTAESLAEQGRVAEAFDMLSARAGEEAEAARLLADWRMSGQHIRRDIADARRLYGISADLGSREAEDCYIALLASGAGGSGRLWDTALSRLRTSSAKDHRRELAIIDAMALDSAGDPLTEPIRQKLDARYPIWQLPSFLTRNEARYLGRLAKPRLQPSVVVHPSTGQFIRDPIRDSSAAAFPFTAESPAVHAINRRIARASGTACEQGEPLQILHYTKGQQYKTHSDALPGADNQRILTFLIYLNDDFDGGETVFPNIGQVFRGKAGDALMFVNVDESGALDQRMVHRGAPVRKGQKYIASKWIRHRPLDLRGPPGRPF